MRNVDDIEYMIEEFEADGNIEFYEVQDVVAWIEEYDDSTQCWIHGNQDGKLYGSSLGLAQDLGGIECHRDCDNSIMELSQKTLDRIYEWAYNTGKY